MVVSLVLSCTVLTAQKGKTGQEPKGARITIQNADKGIYQKRQGKNRLLGNVVFEHEGALMYCDSAWLFSEENRIKAFENVKINQGDTIFLWGDYLEYSGNTRLARVTGEEVRLQDPEMTLYTTELDYDRNQDLAYYHTGGRIEDEENELTSRQGYYHSGSKVFNFKDSVILVNPEYTIKSDTLIYHSEPRVAYFQGPTTITSDSSFIYCENGRYNTVSNIAQFKKNAYLYDDNRYLTGDSLYYERQNNFGEAFENVLVHDTIENYTITGGYGRYLGASDSIFVTFDPVYSIKQEQDTLHIHGDTLFSAMRTDSLMHEFRQLKVYHKVKFFKNDLQGKCDSLTYNSLDSIIRMYHDPILWNDSSQVTGDTIYLTMRNKKLDSLKVLSNAFIINRIEENRFNQIKGRKVFGKFNRESALSKVYVNGNGQTIYYPEDEQTGDYIGMNKAVCSNILVRLRENKIRTITFLTKPDATLHPLAEATPENSRLEGFTPRFEERPQSKEDLLKE